MTPALQMRMSRQECVKFWMLDLMEAREVKSQGRKVRRALGVACVAEAMTAVARSELRPVK
jgi:hypothetical protein